MLKPVLEKAKLMDLVYMKQEHETQVKNKQQQRFRLLQEIHHHVHTADSLQKKIEKIIIDREL